MKRFRLQRPTNQSGNALPGCIIVILIMIVLGGIAVMLAITSFGQKKPEGTRIAKVGKWQNQKVEIDPYQTWYGLFQKTEGVFSLKKVKLKVKELYDHSTDGPREKTGIQVDINSKDFPILLITGSDRLQKGTIEGKNHDNALLAPDRQLEIDYSWGHYSLSAFGAGVYPGGEDTESQFSGYGIELAHESTKQSILEDHHFYGDGPGLIWSGDLDRDGKLDLIIDCICEGASTNMALFLSSKADKNELVKLVAFWQSKE